MTDQEIIDAYKNQFGTTLEVLPNGDFLNKDTGDTLDRSSFVGSINNQEKKPKTNYWAKIVNKAKSVGNAGKNFIFSGRNNTKEAPKFEKEEELTKAHNLTIDPNDPTSYYDSNGNAIPKAEFRAELANPENVPDTTIITTEGNRVAVDPSVDAKKLGGVASIETHNDDGTITEEKGNPGTAEADVSKHQEDTKAKLEEMGVDTTSAEDEVPEERKKEYKDSLFEQLLSTGLIKMNPDGTVSIAPYKPSTKSTMAKWGTAFSIVLTLITGGLVPPINFSALSGMDKEDEKGRNIYEHFANSVADTYGDVFKIEKTGQIDESVAEAAGIVGYKSSGAYARDLQGLQSQLRMLKESNAAQKDVAEFMAKLGAKKLPLAMQAAEEAGYSLDQLASYVKTTEGITSWDDALNKLQKIRSLAPEVGLGPEGVSIK